MAGPSIFHTEKVCVYYRPDKPSLVETSLIFPKNQIAALIGPSGSGKSTYLRCLNRMNDEVAKVTGKIIYDDVDINTATTNVYRVRQKIGMAFQHPNPFARSIRENLLLAPKQYGMKDKQEMDSTVGMRSKTTWIKAPSPSRGASNNGSALPGPSRSTRTSYSWMSRPAPWTRCRPLSWKKPWPA